MADPVRKAHPDVALAITAANTSREYHVLRVSCMDGSYAEYYENAVRNRATHKGGNPPVGEYCTALMRNSADVNASPQRLNDRPETSLLAPYLGMMSVRNSGDSFAAANALNKEFVRRSQSSETSSSQEAARFGNTTPPFVLTHGVALDAAFTRIVLDTQQPNATRPPLPTRSMEALYAITDSCFRNTGVTIGECAQAGKDQAALYLNQTSTVSQAQPPATPTQPARRSSPQRN